jgi:hypothetical protein
MVTLSTLEAAAKSDYTTVTTEYGFVRSNWGKLSAIVIGAFALGFLTNAFVHFLL